MEATALITGALPLTAVIGAATVLAFWLDYKIPALGKVGASLMALGLGALLSNAGLIPGTSPVYDTIAGPVTMLAIVWLLLAVNLADLGRAGPHMVGAFCLAALGTALGALVGAFFFADSLGENTWKLAGVLTGTYSGGSVNFVAVNAEVEIPASLFAGATAADATTTAIWMAATLMLPTWIGRFYPPVPTSALEIDGGPVASGGQEDRHAQHPFFVKEPSSTLDLAKLMAAALVLLAGAGLLADGLKSLAAAGRIWGWVGSIPEVLWLTTFALILGHTKWFHRPAGAMQMGTLALHFFFVVIGAWSRVSEILSVGVEVFFYTLAIIVVHGLVVFGVGRLVRIDVGTLAVASQAAVGGPPSALAVAVSREWPGLVLPGIVVGLLGYAVGTHLGFGVAYLLRGLGVGL